MRSSKEKEKERKNSFDEMITASATKSKQVKKEKKSSKSSAAGADAAAAPVYSGLGKKILVFVHHKDVMDAIEDSLRELAVQYVRIDGGVSAAARNTLIARFQEDDVVSDLQQCFVHSGR